MPAKKCFNFVHRDNSPVAEVFIFDQIGASWLAPEGVVAREFVAELGKHKERDLLVHLNCPGGSVFEGYAIYNALAAHPKHVECRISGLCASIATPIALAGKTVSMAETAMFMIHNPRAGVEGEASDMRSGAALLDKLAGQIADVYVAKTGKPKDEILAAMDEETWLTADEAKEWGFVDSITSPVTPSASFDLARFSKVPTALAPAPTAAVASVKQAWAKDAVNLMMRLTGCYNASNEQIEEFVRAYAKNPTAAQKLIEGQISDGTLLVAAAPLGPGCGEQSQDIESEYKAYMAKYSKFRNRN